MGADLYIQSQHDKTQKKWGPIFEAAVRKRDGFERGSAEAEEAQKEVDAAYKGLCSPEGYFRDSYNCTSILWQLGLSWWRDVGDMLDDEGYMQPEKIKEFLAMIEAAELPEPEQLKLENATIDDGENSREAWHKSFVDHRKQLIAFLGHALDLNEPIYCSI
jgi:hypothetical protein